MKKKMKRKKNREMKSIIYKNKEFTHTKKRRGRKKNNFNKIYEIKNTVFSSTVH